MRTQIGRITRMLNNEKRRCVMKTFLAVLAVTAFVLTGAARAADWSEGGRVRIATEGEYPPWNYKDGSGRLVGFEIDLAVDLCKRMKIECEMTSRPWKGMIGALRSGEFDVVMASISITAKRKKIIAFSRSYADTPAAFAVRSDGPLAGFSTRVASITMDDLNPAEKAAFETLKMTLAGMTIGTQFGTTFAHFLKIHMADTVKVRTYDIQGNLDAALLAGQVDAALAEMSYWKPLLAKKKRKVLKIIGPGFTGGPFGAGIGVGVRHEDRELAEMFSAAINAAIKDGTLSRLAIQWFGFDLAPKE